MSNLPKNRKNGNFKHVKNLEKWKYEMNLSKVALGPRNYKKQKKS